MEQQSGDWTTNDGPDSLSKRATRGSFNSASSSSSSASSYSSSCLAAQPSPGPHQPSSALMFHRRRIKETATTNSHAVISTSQADLLAGTASADARERIGFTIGDTPLRRNTTDQQHQTEAEAEARTGGRRTTYASPMATRPQPPSAGSSTATGGGGVLVATAHNMKSRLNQTTPAASNSSSRRSSSSRVERRATVAARTPGFRYNLITKSNVRGAVLLIVKACGLLVASLLVPSSRLVIASRARQPPPPAPLDYYTNGDVDYGGAGNSSSASTTTYSPFGSNNCNYLLSYGRSTDIIHWPILCWEMVAKTGVFVSLVVSSLRVQCEK